MFDLHAKKRANEVGISNLESVFNYVIYNGYHASNCPDNDIKEYILRKSTKKGKNFKVKVYDDIVFIYYKSNKEMITCYRLPNHLCGRLNYSDSELKKHRLERNV